MERNWKLEERERLTAIESDRVGDEDGGGYRWKEGEEREGEIL